MALPSPMAVLTLNCRKSGTGQPNSVLILVSATDSEPISGTSPFDDLDEDDEAVGGGGGGVVDAVVAADDANGGDAEDILIPSRGRGKSSSKRR